MGAFDGFRVSASGMDAQLQRLQAVASNLANANTTRTAEGGPYRRKDVAFAAIPVSSTEGDPAEPVAQGVAAASVVEDTRPPKKLFMPNHPDADPSGYVGFPNIEPLEEMVNMMDAIRSYEANVTSFNTTKDMMKRALEIGR